MLDDVSLPLTLLHSGGCFFEGPRWHEGRWWVSDIPGLEVLSVTPDGDAEVVLHVEGRPSGLGWLPDDTLLIVSQIDRQLLRRAADGTVAVHADLKALCSTRINDMVVDAHGRAYVGSTGVGGDIFRVDLDGSVSVAATDLFAPNGTVITPDGGTLIVGESLGNRYSAFPIADDGTLGERRDWARFGETPEPGLLDDMRAAVNMVPDGCALDATGHIWMADAHGGSCLRIEAGGTVVDEIEPPSGFFFFACMLGGDDGRTLLLCAAPPDAHSSGAVDTGLQDAVLYTARVDEPHAGLP